MADIRNFPTTHPDLVHQTVQRMLDQACVEQIGKNVTNLAEYRERRMQWVAAVCQPDPKGAA